MKSFSAAEISQIVHGTVSKGDPSLVLSHASLYVETINHPNTVLFLKNKWRFDPEPLRKHTPCAVVTEDLLDDLEKTENCTIIRVDDIGEAYWRFVEYYRSLLPIPVVAITGTSGKTTTKDMIKHILKAGCKVQGTEYSANGCTGHLYYLQRLDESVEAAVFETAVGRPGDILYSCRHFKPTIGIITNIGIDHLDGCKTVEGYAKAKLEMLEAVSDGILVLNADDEVCRKIDFKDYRGKFSGRVVYYGIQNRADFQASGIHFGEEGMEFILTLNRMKYPIFVPGFGEHQVYDALAALAAAHELGVGMKEAGERLRSFSHLPNHMQVIKGLHGCTILDDTWNINPTSLEAALKTLCMLGDGKRRVALIGHMNALGENAERIARRMGALIASAELDELAVTGSMAEAMADEAVKKGLKCKPMVFENLGSVGKSNSSSNSGSAIQEIDAAFQALEPLLDENTVLLAKCSMFDAHYRALFGRLKA